MALFRDDPKFAAGITEAASRLGLTRPFVEKDYWVTQVLRALHLVFPGQFLLTGGTSLSKGYGDHRPLLGRRRHPGRGLAPGDGDGHRRRARTPLRRNRGSWAEACPPVPFCPASLAHP
jgi:hypothetical protein